MSEIIASTYEITERLGSGGGGVVYLARHLRLGKWVVLKADRRTVKAPPEVLRREVDALKNLSHTYIPQVYDFLVEGDMVYTVMDFIEGESLDKPLSRGESFSQAQIIGWARQLLEALIYLHSRPPHGLLHGDIKPANIMVTPEGDIRLIDFNIALALGEEGAVQVGYSLGYASPEHYGVSLSGSDRTIDEATEVMTAPESQNTSQFITEVMDADTHSRHVVLLDARSDLYSLGATLYHLFSGHRPPKDAQNVPPLSKNICDPAVSAIVAKAMAPNPDLRYQTAAEMLQALEDLHSNDPRAVRLKRRRNIAVVLLAATFLAGGGMAFGGLRLMERAQAAAALEAQQHQQQEQESREALGLVQSAQDAFRMGDKETAKRDALEALGKDSPYAPAAQRILTQALGIYDLADGFKAHTVMALPGRAIKQVLSPDGRYVAVLTSGQVSVVKMDSGQIIAQLPANASAYSDMVFAGDNTIIYAGAEGLNAYDLTAQKQLWCIDSEKGETITLSGDNSKVAVTGAGSSSGRIYNVATGEKQKDVDWAPLMVKSAANDTFADPMDDLFVLDDSGRYLAVSFENGGLSLMDGYAPENSVVILAESDYTCFEGGFFDGVLGVCASDGVSAEFLAVDVQAGELIATLSSNQAMHLKVCADGFCLAQSNVLVRLDPETGEQTELAYTQEGIRSFSHVPGCTLVQTETGSLLFFDENAIPFDQHDISNDFAGIADGYAALSGRDTQTLQILKLETYPEKTLSTYPGDYFHDEARVTSDGNILLYSAQGAILCGPDGILRGESDFSAIQDQIYDIQYCRENGTEYLEVLYDSIATGFRLRLSAQDLSVIGEDEIPLSDETLYEEFTVGNYIVRSPLHETPVVVDAATGEIVKELESDGYLTYVTAVEGGVITEYVTTDGIRYGLLLNQEWETIADLPGLCDILPDETLVFDNTRGTLRQSKIYPLSELIELAQQ